MSRNFFSMLNLSKNKSTSNDHSWGGGLWCGRQKIYFYEKYLGMCENLFTKRELRQNSLSKNDHSRKHVTKCGLFLNF